jgi:MYXO-CTERM domain-containing protein
VVSLFKNLFESGEIGEDPNKHNPIAQRHLALSALWHDSDPSADQLQKAVDTALLTTAVSAAFAKTRPDWPLAPGPTSRDLPAWTGPLLMLHGELDPTMPPERLAALPVHFTGASQLFAIVSGAGHVTINENPCVRSIYVAFIRAPVQKPDTSCLASLRRPSLVADSATAKRVFGTADIWGDQPGGSGSLPIYTGLAVVVIVVAAAVRRRRRSGT